MGVEVGGTVAGAAGRRGGGPFSLSAVHEQCPPLVLPVLLGGRLRLRLSVVVPDDDDDDDEQKNKRGKKSKKRKQDEDEVVTTISSITRGDLPPTSQHCLVYYRGCSFQFVYETWRRVVQQVITETLSSSTQRKTEELESEIDRSAGDEARDGDDESTNVGSERSGTKEQYVVAFPQTSTESDCLPGKLRLVQQQEEEEEKEGEEGRDDDAGGGTTTTTRTPTTTLSTSSTLDDLDCRLVQRRRLH